MFNFQLVLKINNGSQRIIFAGTTDLLPDEVISLSQEELCNPDEYEIENFIYQPVKPVDDETSKKINS